MTGLEHLAVPAGGALVKVIIERGAPAGFGFVRSLLRGKTIMVVGPPRSGKSTFVTYLQFGIFQDAQETEKTYHPVESPRFSLRLGPNRNLEVEVKTIVDLPGQYPDLSKNVFEHRPHALVIILDMSAPQSDVNDTRSSALWLEDFCNRLDQRWQGQKAKRNRCRSVIVAMNKIDMVKPEVVDKYEEQYRAIMKQSFRAARGSHLSDVHFRRSIMVENADGTKLIDAILVDLAQAITATK
jgi:signal recognition particle receptor subunit beta